MIKIRLQVLVMTILATAAILAPRARREAPPQVSKTEPSPAWDAAVPQTGQPRPKAEAEPPDIAPPALPPHESATRVAGYARLARKALRTNAEEATRLELLGDGALLRDAADRLANGDLAAVADRDWTDAELGVPAGLTARDPSMKPDLVRLAYVDLLVDALAWRANPAFDDAWEEARAVVEAPLPLDYKKSLGDKIELLSALRRADPERARSLTASLTAGRSDERLVSALIRFK